MGTVEYMENKITLHRCALDLLECLDENRVPPMKQIESARLSRRPRRELTLEESWTSLSVFNQMQKGRISLDLQGQSVSQGYSRSNEPLLSLMTWVFFIVRWQWCSRLTKTFPDFMQHNNFTQAENGLDWTKRLTCLDVSVKNTYRWQRMMRVWIGGTCGRRNVRPCCMQQRIVQFSDVPWKWWW